MRARDWRLPPRWATRFPCLRRRARAPFPRYRLRPRAPLQLTPPLTLRCARAGRGAATRSAGCPRVQQSGLRRAWPRVGLSLAQPWPAAAVQPPRQQPAPELRMWARRLGRWRRSFQCQAGPVSVPRSPPGRSRLAAGGWPPRLVAWGVPAKKLSLTQPHRGQGRPLSSTRPRPSSRPPRQSHRGPPAAILTLRQARRPSCPPRGILRPARPSRHRLLAHIRRWPLHPRRPTHLLRRHPRPPRPHLRRPPRGPFGRRVAIPCGWRWTLPPAPCRPPLLVPSAALAQRP